MKNACKTLVALVMLAAAGCREEAVKPEPDAEGARRPRAIPSAIKAVKRPAARAKAAPARAKAAPARATNACARAASRMPVARATDTLKKLSAELKARGDGLTTDDALALLGKHLGGISFAEAFPLLSEAMTSADAEGRIAALNVLAILKGEWCDEESDEEPPAEAPADGDADVAEAAEGGADVAEAASDDGATASSEDADDGAPEERNDVEQQAVYAMMTLGLQDESAAVRDAAYETFATLPQEERSALSMQILGNDDVALKERLLKSCAGDDGEFARGVSFQGLDAEEPSVRALAEANVKQITGRSFASAGEALAWYEQQISVGE